MTTAQVSLEEYLTTSYEPDAEYLDGVLEGRNAGEYDHSVTQTAITFWFHDRRKEWNIRSIFTVRTRLTLTRYRVPDISILSRDRPMEQIFTKPQLITIEVLSPEDRHSKLQSKIEDYIRFQVPNIWFVDPETRTGWDCSTGNWVRKERFEVTDTPIYLSLDEMFSRLDAEEVSKTYSLIQHREVLTSIYRALKLVQLDCSEIESSLVMSKYGEWLQWSCQLPTFDFDPGDGYPIVLRINCLNSVDTTASLEVTLSWFRLVCKNGMMFGLGDSKLRKRHIRSLDPADVALYLREQFDQVESEKELYREWLKHPIDLGQAAKWADTTVAEEWGPHAAARVWCIISEGADGEVQHSHDKRLPHELTLKSLRPVPGAPYPRITCSRQSSP